MRQGRKPCRDDRGEGRQTSQGLTYAVKSIITNSHTASSLSKKCIILHLCILCPRLKADMILLLLYMMYYVCHPDGRLIK